MILILRPRFIITLIVLVLVVITIFYLGSSDHILKFFYPIKYSDYVYQYAGKNDLDPYLVFAIIKAESGFDPKATSNKDARGLMQVTDKTGKWAAKQMKLKSFSIDQLYEAETNIKIGCWYLRNLKSEFNSIDLAIAAYNGGSGNVSRWLKDKAYSRSGTQLDKIPFKETDEYLRKVKKYYSIYKKLYEKEF